MANKNQNNLSESVRQENTISEGEAYLQFRQLHVRPWVRFWAKGVDLSIPASLINSVLIFFYTTIPSMAHLITSIVVALLWFLLIEPYCLMRWGTTLGRFLFNFTLRKLDGSKLSQKDATNRSFKVWYNGFACGVPILSSIANYLAYRQLKKSGATSWDKGNYVVTHGKLGFCRICLALLILFGPPALMLMYQLKYLPPATLVPVPTANVIQSTDSNNSQGKNTP